MCPAVLLQHLSVLAPEHRPGPAHAGSTGSPPCPWLPQLIPGEEGCRDHRPLCQQHAPATRAAGTSGDLSPALSPGPVRSSTFLRGRRSHLMTLARVAASRLGRCSRGQPARPCDRLAAIPGPQGGWGTVTRSESHPAAAHEPGEPSCGVGKFLMSSACQTGQLLTAISRGRPTCRAARVPLLPASQNPFHLHPTQVLTRRQTDGQTDRHAPPPHPAPGDVRRHDTLLSASQGCSAVWEQSSGAERCLPRQGGCGVPRGSLQMRRAVAPRPRRQRRPSFLGRELCILELLSPQR